MRWRTALSTTAVAGVVAFGFAAPAEAALTTRCDGVASDVTVPGNLVVPAGASCDLTNVVVNGNITVQADGDLLADGVEITGNLVVQENGYADTTGTTVEGRLALNSAFGAYVEDSNVEGVSRSNDAGFLYSIGTDHGGNVNSTNGETFLESATVSGNVVTDGDLLTDVYDTWISGNLRVANSEQGGVLCLSEVDGNVVYEGNDGLVQVSSEEPLGGCGTSYIGGNLRLTDNTGDTYVSDTIIRGNLVGTGNDPAPFHENNRVRGNSTGQFAEENPPAAASAMMMRSAEKAAANNEVRKADVLERIEARKAEGAADAAAAGKADIG